jgi:hypothetical protein
MAFAMMLPATAFAAGTGVSYNTYTVEGTNTGGSTPIEDGQHVQLTFNYSGSVVVTPPAAGDSWNNYIAISIAGRNIEDDTGTYYRPYTVTSTGSSLLIDIGPVMSGSTPAFTAQFEGTINLQTKNLGTLVTAGGTGVDDITLYTVIPTQVHVMNQNVSGGVTTAIVDSRAVVRGMFHVGIYRDTANGLEPVWAGTDTSPIQVRTYTAHAHSFTTMTTDDLAAEIVSAVSGDPAFPSGYTIGSSGSVLTVTSADKTEMLYIYVFDDNLLQLESMTYAEAIASDGVLNGVV